MLISDMQLLSGWNQPGNVGDDGGGSAKPNGKFVMIPGSPATFVAAGNYPYNDGIFDYQVPGAWDTMTYFEYSLTLAFPSQAAIDASQAFEFQVQQNVGSAIYNMGWQFDFLKTKFVCTFDYNKQVWVPTTIPTGVLNLTPGAVNTILVRNLRQNGFMTHLSITVNGTQYLVNATRPATPMVESDYVKVAVQLDSDGNTPPTPYMASVDRINLMMEATTA